MFTPPFLKTSGHRLIQARDIPQQSRTGRIDIDANIIHATLNDRIKGCVQVPRFDIVLVQANANVCRLNLNQFGERILQPTANRYGTADGGLVTRQFFTSISTR